MKNLTHFITLLLLCFTIASYAQPGKTKLKVTGRVVEKNSKQPLEYATITLKNNSNPKIIAGGVTNNKGEFSVDLNAGTYDIIVEFISFKPFEIKQKNISDNVSLGLISLTEDAAQLNEVVIRAEKTTVDIKLDKKVYNVGSDLMVKGGTVSDVLDNIPSVAVDAEGNVSLRGNENVRILIDGRPSNAINITEALRLIPADAIEKVEVVTNPSARYDAEGGGGLLNIILKKGKNQGFNGTFIANTGYPDNHGLSGTLNYKTEKFNLFTTQGYNYRNNPGRGLNDSKYFNTDGTTKSYVYEDRENDRFNSAYNGTAGIEWYINKSTSWTNSINYRKSNGNNEDNVFQDNYDKDFVYEFTRNRLNKENSDSENFEYTSNFIKNFKKEGHKLSVDISISSNKDLNSAIITDKATNDPEVKLDDSRNNQDQKRNLFVVDYVLPLGKGQQFEAGYRGDFTNLNTDYAVTSSGTSVAIFTNFLEYKEKVNALYTQYGVKVNKLSMLFGMRYEDSNIDINFLKTNDFNTKKYSNLFPSAFFTYELSDKSSTSISYSKRIQRPRGRFLNPFNNFSSNINIFVGNPDLDPALTDAIDFGYIKRWEKLTLSTSLYYNTTKDAFQFIRRDSGKTVNGITVIESSPINLGTEMRTGFEVNLNYSPYKWWKLNSNFNFFAVQTRGDYEYTTSKGEIIVQNFDFDATSWSTRLTSKITLPAKIDWQTNLSYNGPQDNAQGKRLGILAMNLGFSKDILKDKATVAFNISDVFNSRKMMSETHIPSVESYSEMQFRIRQVTLSFTYRFNKPKNEREKPKRNMNEGEMEFQG
ncbi:Outer membrane receptor proteins, mostly Fe transport [Flavobacterium succinicans]|uniref:Outer membrane receptor proteins, mostly Fe transport n=1 Tax=Flavobacterium succinicans TaxID=29536 RepID=A0A1I4Z101_9FLAO|nr:outer membrane beta-barrel family protein [Flavobacterium succinicans]SFN43945.1 Outer membrane receptor proteins, mostly Fe transport [Flavobacterium succinicans]